MANFTYTARTRDGKKQKGSMAADNRQALIQLLQGRGLTPEPKLESSAWVEHTNRAYAGLFTTFVAHVNRAGFEDGLNYWGGSTIFDPDGKLLIRAPYFEESFTITAIDLNQLHRTRARLPLLRDERSELVKRELERILHGN